MKVSHRAKSGNYNCKRLYEPLTPKSTLVIVLPPVLSVLVTDSPVTPPCLFMTPHVCE
jgi:hypothetical protein